MASVESLTLEEIHLLKPWVRKLELLERGAFPANTEARSQFLQVCWGEADPDTALERAYLKWRVTKPDLDLLETDLEMLTAKAERLQKEVTSARESGRRPASREGREARSEDRALGGGASRAETAERTRPARQNIEASPKDHWRARARSL